MAGTSSSLGEQIREELSCSICLDLFTRPKVLPCQHTFCQECLQQLAGKKKTLECPTCRLRVRLPSKGVKGLPDSCIVANMCERLQNQATPTERTRDQPPSGNRCSLHPFEVLKVYCTECQVPVCVQCLEGTHEDHRTTTMKKAAQERRSTVQALISEGRNILESYCSFIRELRDREKALHEQKQQTDNQIIQTYNTLLSEVDQNHRKNLDTIQKERIRVLADVNELSAICDQAEQEMEQGGVHFLSQENILEETVGKYRDKGAPNPVQTQPAVFQPTDTLVPSLPIPPAPSSNSAAECKDHLHRNQVKEEHLYQRMTFGGRGEEMGKFDNPSGVTVIEGQIFVADFWNQRMQVFTLQGEYVRQFPRTVSSDEQKMNPDNVAMAEWAGVPRPDWEKRRLFGQRYLYMWVVGRTKSDASFAVQFRTSSSSSIYHDEERVSKIDLQRTGWIRGIAVDNRRKHILLTQTTGDSSKQHGEVQVYSADGKLQGVIGQQQGMKYPQHITVDGEGNILVSDNSNHCIYVFNDDGQFQFKFGHKGSGEGQLNRPRGICTDREGNIIVADRHNSRVEMFDKTGRFLKHITTDIEDPKDVAVAPKGQVVVTDDTNHTVTIFTPSEPEKENC